MGFNSLEFLIFVPIVFGIYWYLHRSRRNQNLLLLVASYLFYGLWDWRFLALIIASSAVDFYVGKNIPKYRGTSRAKQLVWLSVAVNLGLLGFFKYFGFFQSSLIILLSAIGIHVSPWTLNIILPVGISFYTFQTLSYTIDVYRGRIEHTDDWITFFAFVSFFPQLAAGPIERASFLMPQFLKSRRFNLEESKEGLRYILYGLFKKVVIADYCAVHADEIFMNYQEYGGSDLFLGAYAFNGMELYCDFSAYSEIALGTALLFGFKLSRNFAYPFFAKNIEEFWQRWHITLSRWFRDYVLILSRRSETLKKIRIEIMTLFTFALIGFWHGANYTFIIWGLGHGTLFITYQRLKKWGWVNPTYGVSQLKDIPNMALMLLLVGFWNIFSRSPSLTFAVDYASRMIDPSFFTFPEKAKYLWWSFFILFWEWMFRTRQHGLAVAHLKKWQRWTLYVLMTLVTMYFFGQQRDFVYYQF